MLAAVDHRTDPAAWAATLGISREAVELYLDCEVIDLHIESFSWTRSVGYDLRQRHGPGLLGARYYGQLDLVRAREARIAGGMWSITTSPFGSAERRLAGYKRGLARFESLLASVPDDVALVRDHGEYAQARARDLHAAFVAVQGGNAFDRDHDALCEVDERLLRVTLVHMSNSRIGRSSSPLSRAGGEGLSDFGRAFVEHLNARRIFVDLAHIDRAGFFDAMAVHDRALPVLVTHTGVNGVHACWRNLDDDQLRAVADTGGVVGVVFHSWYLGDPYFWGGRADRIVDHLGHIVRAVGEDHAAIGSDFDGAIIPPRDLPTCLELPRLVQRMLDRGWGHERIRKILGRNFLRTLRQLRG